MTMKWCMNGCWVMKMMFVIICCSCSLFWIVKNYVEMWQLYVDLCGDDWWCICVGQPYVACIVNIVGDCIYVMWWWIVVDCIYTNIGDVEVNCLCEHMHYSWVICSCIHDWWWWILYPIEVITMFLLHRRWRPWGVLVPHASRWV